MRRLTPPLLLCFIFLVFGAFSAHANTITQVRLFDASAGFVVSGAAGTVLPFDRFDDSLGTLDAIDLELTGSIRLHGLVPSNFVATGPTLVPVPYPFSVTITQSYAGLAFLNDPQIILTGTASGELEPLDALYLYTYSFSFDSLSELLGFAPVAATDFLFATVGALAVPPGFALGGFSDFTTSIPGPPLIIGPNTLVASGFPAATGGPFVGSLSNEGSLLIRYHFSEPAAAVPEPSSLLLVLAALAGAGCRRVRRSGRRAQA